MKSCSASAPLPRSCRSASIPKRLHKAAALFLELDPIASALTGTLVGQLRGPVGKQDDIEELSENFKDIARTALAIGLDEPNFSAAAYRHLATCAETPVATHADALLQLLEDHLADSQPQLAAKAALRAKFTAYELPTGLRRLQKRLPFRQGGEEGERDSACTAAADTLRIRTIT